jgi:hypothetical protein
LGKKIFFREFLLQHFGLVSWLKFEERLDAAETNQNMGPKTEENSKKTIEARRRDKPHGGKFRETGLGRGFFA